MQHIKLDNISLNYPVYIAKTLSLGNKIRSFIRGENNYKEINALKDINLDFKDGDRIGLLGKNGAGKSTLIRIISGIIPPSKGKFEIKGKVLSIVDPGCGINIEASGYDNIFLVLYLRGLSNNEIKKKIKWIIDFSELAENIYLPVRVYSSGMMVRLSTSIILSLEPEIFIVDEFFGGGDKFFIDKLTKKVTEMINQSGIFICASHNEKFLSGMCNRFIHLKDGKVVNDGNKMEY